MVSYQLLAGRLPYEAASLTDLARQQDTTAPPPLHDVDPAIPRALSQVVARALAREPGDRFPDAASLEHALAGALRGVAPPEPTAATRALDDETEATRKLDRTAVTTPLTRTQAAPPRRRRLEPIDEPPVAPPPRRATARAAATAPAARRKRPGRTCRLMRTLLILALFAVVAAGAYVLTTETGQRGVELKEQIQGDVNQAVQEIQDLIEENTR